MAKGKSMFVRAATGNVLVLGLPIVVGFALAFIIGLSRFANSDSPFFYVGFVIMAIGWCLLVRSKWDQIRRGEFMSWGVSDASPKMRMLYRISYATMVAGYLVSTFSGSL